MPDHGGFADRIAALYVAFAEETGRYGAASERVQAVRKRARDRYPEDRATLQRLDELLAQLR